MPGQTINQIVGFYSPTVTPGLVQTVVAYRAGSVCTFYGPPIKQAHISEVLVESAEHSQAKHFQDSTNVHRVSIVFIGLA